MIAGRERRRDDDKLARSVGGRLGHSLACVAEFDFLVRRRAAGDDGFARRIDVHDVEGGFEGRGLGSLGLFDGAGALAAGGCGDNRGAAGRDWRLRHGGGVGHNRNISGIRLKQFRMGPHHGARSGGHDHQSGGSDPNQRIPRRHAYSLSPLHIALSDHCDKSLSQCRHELPANPLSGYVSAAGVSSGSILRPSPCGRPARGGAFVSA